MNEKGQSTIEFIMTFVFSFGVFFLFVRLAFNTSVGFMAHLASYYASRVYLVHETNQNTPQGVYSASTDKAIQTFNQYQLNELGILNSISDSDVRNPSNSRYEFVGVSFKFNMKLPGLSFLGNMPLGSFVAESFLGKEPPRSECLQRLAEIMSDAPNDGVHTTLWDNGC